MINCTSYHPYNVLRLMDPSKNDAHNSFSMKDSKYLVPLYIKQHRNGRDAASKLLPALEKVASSKNYVEVRASLCSNEVESLYGFNMEDVPSIMLSIAQAKARACKNGKTLQNSGVLNI